jgi:hypothetical protein
LCFGPDPPIRADFAGDATVVLTDALRSFHRTPPANPRKPEK